MNVTPRLLSKGRSMMKRALMVIASVGILAVTVAMESANAQVTRPYRAPPQSGSQGPGWNGWNGWNGLREGPGWNGWNGWNGLREGPGWNGLSAPRTFLTTRAVRQPRAGVALAMINFWKWKWE